MAKAKHTYPKGMSPDRPGFVRATWTILDQVPPGVIPDRYRFLLAASIFEALVESSRMGVQIATQRSEQKAEQVMEARDHPRASVLHDPGNDMPRIEQIWAFLSVDAGGEGLVVSPLHEGAASMPLIASDGERLTNLLPLAQHLAKLFGKPVRLAQFTQRKDIRVIEP